MLNPTATIAPRRKAGAGDVEDQRRIRPHRRRAGVALARREAAIVEGDDVRLGIEVGEQRRHRVRIPGIAAEAEDEQPLAFRPRRRDVEAAQALARGGGEVEPLGGRRQRPGGADLADREEQPGLGEEHDRADRGGR